MKLSQPFRRITAAGSVPGRVATSGKFSQPAGEPPAGEGEGQGGTGGGGSGSGAGEGEKTFTQADLNKIAAKQKSEGKAAAMRELAEQLGVPVEEAKAIIEAARKAEDAKKSEAEKDREKAQQELAAAEKAKADAAREIHAARIERALAALGFTGDEAAGKRVHGMVTVEVGGSYEDVLSDVKELQKTLNPELFGGKKSDGKGGGSGRLPGGDPKGGTPKPTGGEGAYAAGQKRFEEAQKKRRVFNPLAK